MNVPQSLFTSPDKSILDNEVEDDESTTSSSADGVNEFPNTSDIPDIRLTNSSYVEDPTQQEENQVDADIKTYDHGADESKGISSRDEEDGVKQNEKEKEISKASSDEENKMVHVHMLDSENFITDWNLLGPLPPPPDHDLHSPIVSEILQQWTAHKPTQDSLMKWIDNVMSGVDPNDVQPLQISSLTHQLRDAFSMHILPHLLRRSDIHVEVTTRAQRHTSYDMMISINSPQNANKTMESGNNDDIMNHSKMLHSGSPHMMAFKASGGSNVLDASKDQSIHSRYQNNNSKSEDLTKSSEIMSDSHSAVTSMMSNHALKSHQNYVSHDTNNQDDIKSPQSSIVAGAISAVGGLLSRRKTNDTDNQRNNEGWSLRKRSNHSSSPPNLVNTDLSTSSSFSVNEEEQPYHRVVSAPPGKIGITFVQYRGHAMISDVYQDSPLLGWVFPSDILIAIDEVPVSGMRVPEIVKLLTGRKERQRALRLISSHAMSELLITEDTGALIDG